MEAVGAASALLTVVTATIQSTIVVYEAATAITEGPKSVGRLADAAIELIELLKRFERFEPRLQVVLGQHGADSVNDLGAKLGECTARMNRIRDELQPYQQTSNERRRDTIKRALRHVVGQKQVENWWKEIHTWINLLGVYVGELDLNLNLSNAESQAALHSTIVSSSQRVTEKLGTVESLWERQYQDTRTQLRNIGRNQQTIFQREQNSTTNQGYAFNNLTDGIDRLGVQSFTMWSGLQDSTNMIRADLDRIPSMLAARVEESFSQSPLIQSLINEIHQLRIASLSTQSRSSISQSPPIINTSNTGPTSIDRQGSLEDPLSSKFVERLEALYDSVAPLLDALSFMDSEAFKHELVQLLNLVLQQLNEESGSHHPHSPMRSKIKAQNECLNTAKDLLRLLANFEVVPSHEPIPKAVPWLQGELGYETDAGEIKTSQSSAFQASRIEDVEKPNPAPSLPMEAVIMPRVGSSTQEPRRNASTNIQPHFELQNRRKRKAQNETTVVLSSPKGGLLATLYPILPQNFQSTTELISLEGFDGKIEMLFKKTIIRKSRHSQIHDQAEDTEIRELFDTKFVFNPPSHLMARGQVALAFGQECWQAGSLLSVPRLSFRRFIPGDSEIFSAIKMDYVEDVSRLFRENKVFVNDRKPNGRSLLSIALQYRSCRIVKYLVERGAEIDAVEPILDDDDEDYDDIFNMASIIEQLFVNHSETSDYEHENLKRCYQVMLTAGVDPVQASSPDFYGYQINLFGSVLLGAPLSIFALMLSLGQPFINVNNIGDSRSRLPALVFMGDNAPDGMRLSNHDARTISEKIIQLIEHGADVNARDDHGNICLHAFLRWDVSRWEQKDYSRVSVEGALRWRIALKDVLMLLTTAGAAVNAVNDAGESLLAVAEAHHNEVLWIEVLVECGYDVEKLYKSEEAEIGYSTAVDSTYAEIESRITGLTSTLSLAEYLRRREATGLSEEIRKFPSRHEELEIGRNSAIREIRSDDEDSPSDVGSDIELGYNDDKYDDEYDDELVQQRLETISTKSWSHLTLWNKERGQESGLKSKLD